MTRTPVNNLGQLARLVSSGDRKSLARAVTLAESTRPIDREAAEALLTALLPRTGGALRIGISGAPGAGKSTFIEALGTQITGMGKNLAVLAVDPSSQRSGGSILGDKTRMAKLARNPRAFIRPSPSGITPGGVARRTREAILLAEAAGYDVVFIETVGVGQSEAAVAEMVDLFVMLVAPGSGDDLQGIKRGTMELADLVLVTKSDGDLLDAASRAFSDYRAALALMRPKYPGNPPEIARVSALKGTGIAEIWSQMENLAERLEAGGHLARLRIEQSRGWFWNEVRAALIEALGSHPAISNEAAALEQAVLAGRKLPEAAARELISAFRRLDGRNTPP
ncbi:MAG TPA: methylmalonyl Co-A mutase-associated GTPase MeaB [Rhizomicrobium sp.]|nr:methylmalonyl Co-A mutase-associated GTPase MeaB [Rhizomicrobium sp.]